MIYRILSITTLFLREVGTAKLVAKLSKTFLKNPTLGLVGRRRRTRLGKKLSSANFA